MIFLWTEGEIRILGRALLPKRQKKINIRTEKFAQRVIFYYILFFKYNYNQQIKDDDMGWKCITHGRKEKCI
jgi:hypothetical protein